VHGVSTAGPPRAQQAAEEGAAEGVAAGDAPGAPSARATAGSEGRGGGDDDDDDAAADAAAADAAAADAAAAASDTSSSGSGTPRRMVATHPIAVTSVDEAEDWEMLTRDAVGGAVGDSGAVEAVETVRTLVASLVESGERGSGVGAFSAGLLEGARGCGRARLWQ
jgi:hypothetical protein